MRRRDFLKTTAVCATAAISATVCRGALAAPGKSTAELAKKLPRWRGFNLLEMFNVGNHAPFVETDFQWISEWGFDFVRLPLDYRCWTDANDPYKLDEKVLSRIDQTVELGKKYGIHVNVSLHRAPGYTVATPAEKLNLWADEEAQKQFDFQWAGFAKRYRGVPSTEVSFDLVNEPANIPEESYAKVARRVVAAIRREDPERLVISDGLEWGNKPIFSLVDLGIGQSTRGYQPFDLTHYMAPWVDGQRFAKPSWPGRKGPEGKEIEDRKWLVEHCIAPWKKLAEKGVGVHVGEWGAFNKTPHSVLLGWAEDCLVNWQEAGWGWALWNFRGSFGILDSQRADVAYEDQKGSKLDRKFLDLLRKY